MSDVAGGLWLALPFAAGAVLANVFPFRTRSDTEVLTALHLPIALWLAVGFAYVRMRWFADGGRMDFVWFSGELAIYARFLPGRSSFAVLERWQVAYLPVYAVWAVLVVVIFPPVFGYR